MCECPINISNPNYDKLPDQMKRILVPCGKCVECLQARAKSWFVRLHYQERVSDSAYFVTLTYDVPRRTKNGYLTVFKPDLQNFMKRLRKREKGNTGISFYGVSEYGSKYHRPHYHLLLFNVRDERNIVRAWSEYELPPVINDDINVSSAVTGAVDIGKVESASIMYVAGYIGKKIGIPFTDDDDREKEFSLMSKHLGINFLDKAYAFNRNNEETYTIVDGITYNLPRYYRDKIWTPIKYLPSSHPALLKPIIKRNRIQNKISKKNAIRQAEAQLRAIKNFNSIVDWEVNRYQFSEIRNQSKQSFVNSKIETR